MSTGSANVSGVARPLPPGAVALVTGASRGIGAEVAAALADLGASVVVNYRAKALRAEKVVARITAAGGRARAVRADLTDADEVRSMVARIADDAGRLDVLVLNASGGLERGVDAGYPLRINRDAQVALVDAVVPLMPSGARIVFVTSDLAHRPGRGQGNGPPPIRIPLYDPIASSKRAGEDALRARVPELAARGVSLVVVTGGMVAGTAAPVLLERANPGLTEEWRRTGRLLTVPEFAGVVASASTAVVPTGHTFHVGESSRSVC